LVARKLGVSFMTTLIIDDNKLARMAMRQLASQLKDLEVVGECADAVEAYNLLKGTPVDLLLLDIEMPGMSGIELGRLLEKHKPIIVFTTSKKEYAAEAFELNVADYLVKPVGPVRFLQAIEKAREIFASQNQLLQTGDKEFVFIRDNGILIRISLNKILYLEAMGDYVKLFTDQRFYAIHITLKTLEEKLPSNNFLRVHRSYIVALDKIDTIEEGVIYIHKTPIPVADAYRSTLNRNLNLL
jgi:two-component system LytT family response regulator